MGIFDRKRRGQGERCRFTEQVEKLQGLMGNEKNVVVKEPGEAVIKLADALWKICMITLNVCMFLLFVCDLCRSL